MKGRLFFGGLRGEALYEATPTTDGTMEITVHFAGDLGRIRAIAAGPDEMLYFSTSNRDGRGSARDGDDRIFRIDPTVLSP